MGAGWATSYIELICDFLRHRGWDGGNATVHQYYRGILHGLNHIHRSMSLSGLVMDLIVMYLAIYFSLSEWAHTPLW